MSSDPPPIPALTSSHDNADRILGGSAPITAPAPRSPSMKARKHQIALGAADEGHEEKEGGRHSRLDDSWKRRSSRRLGQQQGGSSSRVDRRSGSRRETIPDEHGLLSSSRDRRSSRRVRVQRGSSSRSRRLSSSRLRSDIDRANSAASSARQNDWPASKMHFGSSQSIGKKVGSDAKKVPPVAQSSMLGQNKYEAAERSEYEKSTELEEKAATAFNMPVDNYHKTSLKYGKDDESPQKRNSFCSTKCRWIAAIALLVVVASGVGVYFGTRSSEGVVGQSEDVVSSLPPEIDVAPTPDTVTSMPSATPTDGLLFDPPTPAECSALIRGGAVEGQDGMHTKMVYVEIEITLSAQTELGALKQLLKEKLQEVVVPELAGCANIPQNTFSTRGGRRLSEASRYAIANAAVDIFSPVNGSCNIASGPLCYSFTASFDLSLKGDDVRVVTLISLMSGIFGANDSWISKLGLGSPVELISFENIYMNDISESPSASPTTAKPSDAPSAAPTAQKPTVSPSNTPTTAKPTTNPSSIPSNQPSSTPSATDPPTTDFPSSGPTPRPSETTPVAIGSALTSPSEISSSGGVLSATLTIAEESYSIGNSNIRVNGRLLNGEYPGPTFRIKPGDTLRLTYNNDLADQGIGYVHNTYSGNDESNVHFHGLHVSGELPSDDTTHSVGPGESYDYVTTLPTSHMPGTHWLHPHRHGSTTLQVGGGALLAIIVEDEDGTLPAQVQNSREVLFVAQYFNVREIEDVVDDSGDGVLSFSGNTDNEFVAVNGQLNPEIQVDAGEWFRLRVVWANFLQGDLDLRIPGCEMQLLAKDGIYIRDFPREITEAPVPSGGRADIMIRCPDPSTRYTITGLAGGFATVVTTSTVIDSDDLESWTPSYPAYLTDLRGATVSSGCSCETELNGRQVNGISFPSQENFLHTSYLGAVVERSLDSRNHPYHQHVYPFQLIGSGFSSTYNAVGDWQDVVKGRGAIRFSPTEITGKLMLHCHRLVHEDRGMMAMELVGASGSCSCTDA